MKHATFLLMEVKDCTHTYTYIHVYICTYKSLSLCIWSIQKFVLLDYTCLWQVCFAFILKRRELGEGREVRVVMTEKKFEKEFNHHAVRNDTFADSYSLSDIKVIFPLFPKKACILLIFQSCPLSQRRQNIKVVLKTASSSLCICSLC